MFEWLYTLYGFLREKQHAKSGLKRENCFHQKKPSTYNNHLK